MTIQLLGKNLEKGILNWKKLEEVWYWWKKVRPADKWKYKPNKNTILYLPFDWDFLDHSGNNRVIHKVRNRPLMEWEWPRFMSNSGIRIGENISFDTCNFWIKPIYSKNYSFVINPNGYWFWIDLRRQNFVFYGSDEHLIPIGRDIQNIWTNFCLVWGSSRVNIYMNWSFLSTKRVNNPWFYLIGSISSSRKFSGFAREFILSSERRSLDRVSDHYHQSKQLFWL